MKLSWLVPILLAAPAVILDAPSRVGPIFEFRHHFVSLELPSNRGQGDYGLTALAALDIDGDGWTDLVCSGVWYRNPGKPREAAFERIPFAEKAAGAHDILVADVDGDKRADVLMMGDSRTAASRPAKFLISAPRGSTFTT
jgi:hypothetical protein